MTSQKKILLFIGKLGGGGAERVFVEYANGLAGGLVDVHLVVLESGSYETDLLPSVKLYKLGTRMRKAAFPLYRIVRQVRPNVLLSGLTGANLLASIVGRLAGVPEVWVSVHNDLRVDRAVQSASLGRFESLATKIACRLSTQVIAVSEGVADYLSEAGHADKEAISVVYNPIYNDGMCELAKVELPESIKALVDPGQPYLVAAGRLEYQKGFDLLVDAYIRSDLKQQGVHLIILGEGRERAKLSALIESSGLSSFIHLPGFLNNPYAVFSRAQGFVLSSRWEGFGNVLVEALACGTPVVAFDCRSGPVEVIGGAPGCILVSAEDTSSLAKALVKIVTYNNIGNSAGDRISRARRFSREESANKLIKLIYS